MRPALLELQPRCPGETARQIRDEGLSGTCSSHDARRLVDGDASHVRAHELHLSDVHSYPDLEVELRGMPVQRSRTVQRTRRPLEPREHPVAGRVDLPSAEPLELAATRLEELGEKRSPARVAELRRKCGRVDEVREEKRRQNPAVDARGESGPCTEPGPLDLDHGSGPIVKPSWPGGMSKTSPGPNSADVPSANSVPSARR